MRRLQVDPRQIPVGPGQPQPSRRFELAGLEFDDGFDQLATPARFSAAAAGRRIELEFLGGYPCAQVFAPSSGQFICFEPMVAPANALASGDGLRLLDPGRSYSASFAVSIAPASRG
jgi:galactose mutarotase-like enzyme